MSDVVNGPSGAATGPYGIELSGARARLHAAAVEAFAAKGFHGTTTRDIAAAAGMSPAALYVHHRSKEGLLHVISAEGHSRALAICEAAVAVHDTAQAQLERLVVDFSVFHCTHHTLARIVNYELASLAPEHRAEIDAMRGRMDAVVRGILARGVAAGEFDAHANVITGAAILSLGIDIARWYDEGEGWTPQQVAEHYRVLVLRMVGASQEAAGQNQGMKAPAT